MDKRDLLVRTHMTIVGMRKAVMTLPQRFIDGCVYVEGKTKDVCESATDSLIM